jgi:hypothetical protein
MKHNRPLNLVLMILCLALLIVLPLRNLMFPEDVAANIEASGVVVFDPDSVNAGAEWASWVMLFLFGSLSCVFAWRAFGPSTSREP